MAVMIILEHTARFCRVCSKSYGEGNVQLGKILDSRLHCGRSDLAITAFVGASPASAAKSDCDYLFLCVWKDANYSGSFKNWYYCGAYDLRNINWPGTTNKMDGSISSLYNNQSTDTIAVFLDYTEDYALVEIAPGWRDNLKYDPIPGTGRNWNDAIRWASPC
jgi:hypothetical protein